MEKAFQRIGAEALLLPPIYSTLGILSGREEQDQEYQLTMSPKETCENENCLKIQCNKGHPRECSYFDQFQICNFFNCAYKHNMKFSEKYVQEWIKRVAKLETKYNQDKTTKKTVNQSEIELENLKKEVLN